MAGRVELDRHPGIAFGQEIALAEHDLDRAVVGGEFLDQRQRAGIERDHADAGLLEVTLEGSVDHAALPRAPADRLDPAEGIGAGIGDGELVEGLVGHGVVGLAAIAELCRDGGEVAEDAERVLSERVEQGGEGADLGAVDGLEIGDGLVGDRLVGDDAGAMDQAGDRTELAADFGDGRGDTRRVVDVAADIARLAASGADGAKRRDDLARGQHLGRPRGGWRGGRGTGPWPWRGRRGAGGARLRRWRRRGRRIPRGPGSGRGGRGGGASPWQGPSPQRR